MSILIKGRRVITAADDYVGDLHSGEETIRWVVHPLVEEIVAGLEPALGPVVQASLAEKPDRALKVRRGQDKDNVLHGA
jgi:hypothetical protein